MELFYFEAGICIAYATTYAGLAMGMCPTRAKMARWVLWIICGTFAMAAIGWGITTDMQRSVRNIVTGTLCAIAGVAVLESGRFVSSLAAQSLSETTAAPAIVEPNIQSPRKAASSKLVNPDRHEPPSEPSQGKDADIPWPMERTIPAPASVQEKNRRAEIIAEIYQSWPREKKGSHVPTAWVNDQIGKLGENWRIQPLTPDETVNPWSMHIRNGYVYTRPQNKASGVVVSGGGGNVIEDVTKVGGGEGAAVVLDNSHGNTVRRVETREDSQPSKPHNQAD